LAVLARLAPHHRSKLASLLGQTPEFNAADVAVALELVDAALGTPEDASYRFIVCEEADHLLGYACFGHTPMTESCFDLYWLVVAPDARRRGIGRLLVESVEGEVGRAGGRLLRVETSGLESYGGARGLYERAGYSIASRIRDFYASGNDLFVFIKYLQPSALSADG
jgi:ribosomal protein S18 acetylase RimI-like enzyme